MNCVEVLLQAGVDINVTTNEGYTALYFARKLQWEHLIPLLMNSADRLYIN
jgi:ankyrin repeat protein